MTKLYAAYGKQVQRDGEQFADACDETAAQIIADALNDRDANTDPDGTVWRPVNFDPTPGKVNVVAELIEDAKKHINSIGRQFPSGGLLIPPKEPIAILGEAGPEAIMPLHTVTQYNDGERRKCICGRSWDRDEGDECPGAV